MQAPGTLLDGADNQAQAAILLRKANQIRLSAMTMTHHSSLGHTGGDLSSADILATLFLGKVLNLDTDNPAWPQRDRFIMSKGHCSGAFYSILAARGFFPRAQLSTFMDPLSQLNGHPDRNKLPGVEANTGPLGHGLPSSTIVFVKTWSSFWGYAEPCAAFGAFESAQ